MIFRFLVVSALLALATSSFAQTKSVRELYEEVEHYSAKRAREIANAGKALNADARSQIASERKGLAGKHAAQSAAVANLQGDDLYYLALLWAEADNAQKLLDTMKAYLAGLPAGAKGALVQNARSFVIVQSAKRKLMPEAEAAMNLWLQGEPRPAALEANLRNHLALGYYKAEDYEGAVRHAQAAFDQLDKLETKSFRAKREAEQVHVNLVEILALGYKKMKDLRKRSTCSLVRGPVHLRFPPQIFIER